MPGGVAINKIFSTSIMDVKHISITDAGDTERLNVLLDKGYKVWGKPLKMWDNRTQYHYLVYCLVLIDEKEIK